MAAPQQTLTFEQIVARLESIAGKLEGGDVQLEQAVHLFEEGMALSQDGSKRLEAAERRLEVLLANGQTQPLAAAPTAPAQNAAGGLFPPDDR